MKTSLNKLIFQYQLEINSIDENQKMYSGISKLDYHIKGFKRGSVNVCAARKGNGLSILKNQLLIESIFQTTIFTKKNTKKKLYSLLAHKSCINKKKVSHKFFHEHELNHLLNSFYKIQNLPVYIKKRKKLTLDYLQDYLEDNCEIEAIIIEDLNIFIEKEVLLLKEFKKIAKKYNILFLVFLELNSVCNEQSYDKIRPNYIEFYSKFTLKKTQKYIDNLIFIFRPELYDISYFKETKISTENKAEFIICRKKQENKSILVGFSYLKKFYDIGIDNSNWVNKLKSFTE